MADLVESLDPQELSQAPGVYIEPHPAHWFEAGERFRVYQWRYRCQCGSAGLGWRSHVAAQAQGRDHYAAAHKVQP